MMVCQTLPLLQERLNSINQVFTDSTFASISRGLLHQHRMPFAFLLAASISDSAVSSNFHALLRLASKAINNSAHGSNISTDLIDARALQPLNGSAGAAGQLAFAQQQQQSCPCPAGIPQSCWNNVCRLAVDVPSFGKLPEAIESDTDAWIDYALEEREDGGRSPMWSRQPPRFPISPEGSTEESSTRDLSLSERALIAICWRPNKLRSVMHVCNLPINPLRSFCASMECHQLESRRAI
jgi:hypothetical protein